MSEEKKKDKKPKDEGNTSPDGSSKPSGEQRLTIELDTSKELEDLRKKMKAVEDERKAAEAKIKTAEEKYKKLEDEKGQLEIKTTDYEEKLKLQAVKEYERKCEILIEKAKEVFKDPKTGDIDEEKVKQITEKLKDPEKGPENLKMTEYMLGHLEGMIKKGAEQAKTEEERLAAEKKATDEKTGEKQKAAEKAGTEAGSDATGQTPLTGAQTAGKQDPESWDSYVAMIQDLRKRARDVTNPERQAEAQSVLNELWKKWAKEVKRDYRTEARRVHDPTKEEIPSLKELQKDPIPRKQK